MDNRYDHLLLLLHSQAYGFWGGLLIYYLL